MKNLIIRALAGAVFVAVIVGGIYYNMYSFAALFCLITGLSLWEFCGLMKDYGNARARKVTSVAGGVYLFFSTFIYTHGLAGSVIFLPYIGFLMFVFISGLYDKTSNPVNNWSVTLLGQVLCAGSFSLLNFIGEPLYILALFIFVWANDTGAYLVGSAFGRHRLFERISPKKSWEGFFGGLVFALAASLVFARYNQDIGWYNWLSLAAVIVVFGTWGDLVESLLKRTIGIKDSGHIIPGHGGMLDRFDSVMMAIPAMYIYLELFIRN